MMALGPLVLVGIVVAIVLAVQRGARHDDVPPRITASPRAALGVGRTAPPAAELSDTLDRWVADGLLSAGQADAILEHERSAVTVPAPDRHAGHSAPARRIPAYAEALGYLGGVLALAGLTLLVASYWADMSTLFRLALSLVTTVALVGGRRARPRARRSGPARLRWFLWTLSSATAAVFTGVLMIDGLEVDTPAMVVAACAGDGCVHERTALVGA